MMLTLVQYQGVSVNGRKTRWNLTFMLAVRVPHVTTQTACMYTSGVLYNYNPHAA